MGCSLSAKARRVHSLHTFDQRHTRRDTLEARGTRRARERGAKPKRKRSRVADAYPKAKGVVFLFAVDQYQHQLPLAAAVADAVALENALTVLGFVVAVRLFNQACTLEALQNTLRNAADTLDPKTRVLLFFAGHGLRDAQTGRTFYCTYETRQDALVSTSFDIERIFLFADLFPRQQAWILDCCYSGGACMSSTRRGGGYKNIGSPSVQIVSAGRAGEEVLESCIATPQISPLSTPESTPNQTPGVTPTPSPTHAGVSWQPLAHADVKIMQPVRVPQLTRKNIKSKGIFTSFFIRELKRVAQSYQRGSTKNHYASLTDIFVRVRSAVQKESTRWGHTQTPQIGRVCWYRGKRAEGEFVF